MRCAMRCVHSAGQRVLMHQNRDRAKVMWVASLTWQVTRARRNRVVRSGRPTAAVSAGNHSHSSVKHRTNAHTHVVAQAKPRYRVLSMPQCGTRHTHGRHTQLCSAVPLTRRLSVQHGVCSEAGESTGGVVTQPSTHAARGCNAERKDGGRRLPPARQPGNDAPLPTWCSCSCSAPEHCTGVAAACGVCRA